MSDSNRLLIAAAAIALTACALIWGAIGTGVLLRDARIRPQQPIIEALATTHAQQTCANVGGGDDTTQLSKQDLCAQFLSAAAASRSARLSNTQTIIGVCGLIAVLLTLGLNAVATFAATSQANTARRALEDLERPYIVIPTWSSFFGPGLDSGRIVDFEAEVKNSGRSPCTIQYIEVWFAIGSERTSRRDSMVSDLQNPGWMLGPGDARTWKVRCAAIPTAADDAAYMDNTAWLMVRGEILYTDIGGTYYRRCFLYWRNLHAETKLDFPKYNFDERLENVEGDRTSNHERHP